MKYISLFAIILYVHELNVNPGCTNVQPGMDYFIRFLRLKLDETFD